MFKCTTHHHACECREKMYKDALYHALRALRNYNKLSGKELNEVLDILKKALKT